MFGSEEGTRVRRKKHRRLVITRTIILTSKQPEKGVVKAVVVLAFSFSSRAKKTHTHAQRQRHLMWSKAAGGTIIASIIPILARPLPVG